jgi:hypothetical protein
MRSKKIEKAKIKVSCGYTKNRKTAFCLTENEGTESLWRCDKQKNGTWKCGEIAARLSGNVSSALKDALNKAQAGAITSGSD